jgi:hypothetical protein
MLILKSINDVIVKSRILNFYVFTLQANDCWALDPLPYF